MTTYHEILGTDDSSTQSDIKKRYRKLSNQCHPDKGGSNELFKLIGEAYQQVKIGNGNSSAYEGVQSNGGNPDLDRQIANLRKKVRLSELEIVSLAKLLREAREVAIEKHKRAVDSEERNEVLTTSLADLAVIMSQQEDNSRAPIFDGGFKFMLFGCLLVGIFGLGFGYGGEGKKTETIYIDKPIYKDRIVYKDKVTYKDKIIYKDKVIYKDKIVYKDKIIYKDKIVYKDRIVHKTAPKPKLNLWEVSTEYNTIYTSQKGYVLLFSFADGRLYVNGGECEANGFVYIDDITSKVEVSALKKGSTVQCSGNSLATFSLAGFTAAYDAK